MPFILFLFILTLPSFVLSQVIEYKIEGLGTMKLYTKKFDPKAHQLTYCGTYLCLIDGKPFWGSDGQLPEDELSQIIIESGQGSTALDVSSMYEPMFDKDNIAMRIKAVPTWADFYKIRARLSDGAGAYTVEWLVTPKGSARTHIGDGESLYNFCQSMFK